MTKIESPDDKNTYVLRTRKRIKKELIISLVLILLAPVATILAFYEVLLPDGESLAI